MSTYRVQKEKFDNSKDKAICPHYDERDLRCPRNFTYYFVIIYVFANVIRVGLKMPYMFHFSLEPTFELPI